MKRESVLERLQAIKDGADPKETLEWLMSENGADVEREKSAAKAKADESRELKAQRDALQAQIDEAARKSMSEEEQLAKAKADYEAKLADLSTQQNRIDAKKSLTDAGLSTEEADTLLDRFVTPDAKATSDTVSALLSVLDSRREAVETATKQSMLQGTPIPTGNTATGSQSSAKAAYEQAYGANDLVGMAAAIRNGFEQQQTK